MRERNLALPRFLAQPKYGLQNKIFDNQAIG
jgi:hypothetical protein